MTSPRGIRNCNPGNIEDGPFTQGCNGYAGPEPEGRFARFHGIEYGIAALVKLLKVYRARHGLTTVRGIINRWAPPTENETSAYVLAVARDVGVGPDDELADNRETFRALARAIAKHENGPPWLGITETEWDAGMRLAGFLDGAQAAARDQVATTKEAPPAPKEKKMPAPFIGLAFEALLSAIPSLIRNLGTKGSENTERNAKVAEVVVPIAKAAIGAGNEQELVERLTDPTAVAAIDKAIGSQWLEITEAGGGGIEGARAANLAVARSGARLWEQPAFLVTVLVLPLVYYTVHLVLTGNGTFSGELKAAIASSVVTGVLGGVLGFWLGSSFTTSRTRGMGATPTDGIK